MREGLQLLSVDGEGQRAFHRIDTECVGLEVVVDKRLDLMASQLATDEYGSDAVTSEGIAAAVESIGGELSQYLPHIVGVLCTECQC